MSEMNSAGSKPIGESCLSFTIRGEWAHFRRIEGNIVKQTYRLIPRTTVAGLLAAVLGIGRDEYYDRFGDGVSAIAIEPCGKLRTMNVPQNTLSTAKENIDMHPSHGHARIGLPDPTDARQQHNYEMLVEPEYRIDCWLDDENTYTELRRLLDAGESYYPPSLGVSECLASITYEGEHRVESADVTDPEVDSAVVDVVDSVVLEPQTPVRTERSPGFMNADENGRITTGFISYAYSPRGASLTVRGAEACTVDGRTVMFS